jgi:hypothetical protein
VNEAELLAALRGRFPGWAVWVHRGMWRAAGRRLITASSPDLLETAINGDNPFPDELTARRVRVCAPCGQPPRRRPPRRRGQKGASEHGERDGRDDGRGDRAECEEATSFPVGSVSLDGGRF